MVLLLPVSLSAVCLIEATLPTIPSPWQGPFLSSYPFSLAGPFSLQLSLLLGKALFSPTIPSPWQGPFLSNYPFSLAGPFSLQLPLLPGRALFSPTTPSPWQGPFLSN